MHQIDRRKVLQACLHKPFYDRAGIWATPIASCFHANENKKRHVGVASIYLLYSCGENRDMMFLPGSRNIWSRAGRRIAAPRIAGDFYIYAGAVQCPHLQYICDLGICEQEPLSQADKDALLGGNNGAGDHFRGPEHHKSLSGRRCGKP